MRLINTRKLTLERFDDNQIPKYVILSHTWGSEEVSLQQFEEVGRRGVGEPIPSHIAKMKGFYKIEMACREARSDTYDYIWIDTCCIDKTSSSELSEAINSMYSWYQRAKICYAFLEDISGNGNKLKPTGPRLSLVDEAELSKARWFTRGWTLQELIAPASIHFYAKGWTFIGNKSDLLPELMSITGIDWNGLGGRRPEVCSIAKRMSWAARRKTTRVEDMAYCLLGIFNINMPLLYGEGQKAFVRLQEEILKESEDQSLFAWTPLPGDYRYSNISIFASHPSEFANAWNVGFMIPGGEPPAVTNGGIRMELPILKLEDIPEGIIEHSNNHDTFMLVLSCTVDSDPNKHPAIVVIRALEAGNPHTYTRHSTAQVFHVHHKDVMASDMRHVFLRKKGWSAGTLALFKTSESSNNFEEARVYNKNRLGILVSQTIDRRSQVALRNAIPSSSVDHVRLGGKYDRHPAAATKYFVETTDEATGWLLSKENESQRILVRER